MSPLPKVPRLPPGPLVRAAGDVVELTPVLWRIHRTRGAHVLGWNEFRQFGPTASRYDPHPTPRGTHPGYGVLYTATSLRTALAEVFQARRRVNTVTGAPHATSWSPARPLRLLDLTGDWALRNGGAYALASAPRSTCRAWSNAIARTWGDLDGLWAPSTLTGEPMAVLYEHARTSLPAAPAFSRPLAHPLLWSVVEDCAMGIGYSIDGLS